MAVVAMAAAYSSVCSAQNTRGSSVSRTYEQLQFEDYGQPFYQERGRGWHWYETPLAEEEDDDPPPPPRPASPPVAEKPKAPEGPKALSAEWLKENLPKYVLKAIDDPTDENVRAYLYLQRLSMDKAQNYALASQRVTLNDPYLDFNARRPISDAGSQELDRVGYDMKMDLLAEISKTAGLVFFFSSSCDVCGRQWPVMKAFASRYKITVMPVSMDGSILDGMSPKEVVLNRGQDKLMNVTITPTTILFKPPNTYSVVSHGLATEVGLVDNVVSAALGAKIIDDETYMKLQGVRDLSIRASLADSGAEEAIKDNKKLVEYMKSKLKMGRKQ